MKTKRDAAIVYGVYINPDADWKCFVSEQLADLCATGVLDVADLHIVASNPFGVAGVEAFFAALGVPCRRLLVQAENKYEFWALAYLWELAQDRAGYRTLAYLHTKGMSYADTRRCTVEAVLTYYTFASWRTVLEVFRTKPGVHKVGLFPARDREAWGGWMWFNFWWARADYVRDLERPREDVNRFYYEHWLCLSPPGRGQDPQDGYSLYAGGSARFAAADTGPAMAHLRRRLAYRALRAGQAVRRAYRRALRWSQDRLGGARPESQDAARERPWSRAPGLSRR